MLILAFFGGGVVGCLLDAAIVIGWQLIIRRLPIPDEWPVQ